MGARRHVLLLVGASSEAVGWRSLTPIRQLPEIVLSCAAEAVDWSEED
jgi:hypothetical protein